MARAGPKAKRPELHPGLHVDGGDPTLGPLATALPGTLAGNWIGNSAWDSDLPSDVRCQHCKWQF